MAKKIDSRGDKRNPVADALMKQWEDKQWRPLLELVGIKDEETSERMVRILLIHLLLDRAITGVIAINFMNRRLMPDFQELETVIAPLEMDSRIAMAKAAHLISDSCASDIKTVNTVRNKLAHFQPKKGWGLAHVQELSSANAFQQCVNNGRRALKEVLETISRTSDEIFPDE